MASTIKDSPAYRLLKQALSESIVFSSFKTKHGTYTEEKNICHKSLLVKTMLRELRGGHLLKLKDKYYQLEDEYRDVPGGYIKTGRKIVNASTGDGPNEEITIKQFKAEVEEAVKAFERKPK